MNNNTIQLVMSTAISNNYYNNAKKDYKKIKSAVKPKSEFDALKFYAGFLEKKLSAENLSLPKIDYKFDNTFPADKHTILIGFLLYDFSGYDVFGSIESAVRYYSEGINDGDAIEALINSSNSYIEKNKYSKAFEALSRAYYLTFILPDKSEERAMVLFLASKLMRESNQPEKAEGYISSALEIINNSAFLNPYIKYIIHGFVSILWADRNNAKNAANFMMEAKKDISKVPNAKKFEADIYCTLHEIYMSTGDYAMAYSISQEILELLNTVDLDINIDEYKKYMFSIANLAIEQLKLQIIQLQNKNADLTAQYEKLKNSRKNLCSKSKTVFGQTSVISTTEIVKMIIEPCVIFALLRLFGAETTRIDYGSITVNGNNNIIDSTIYK